MDHTSPKNAFESTGHRYDHIVFRVEDLAAWMRYIVSEWRTRQEQAHAVAIAGAAFAATHRAEACVEERVLESLCRQLERVDLPQDLLAAIERLEEFHKAPALDRART